MFFCPTVSKCCQNIWLWSDLLIYVVTNDKPDPCELLTSGTTFVNTRVDCGPHSILTPHRIFVSLPVGRTSQQEVSWACILRPTVYQTWSLSFPADFKSTYVVFSTQGLHESVLFKTGFTNSQLVRFLSFGEAWSIRKLWGNQLSLQFLPLKRMCSDFFPNSYLGIG